MRKECEAATPARVESSRFWMHAKGSDVCIIVDGSGASGKPKLRTCSQLRLDALRDRTSDIEARLTGEGKQKTVWRLRFWLHRSSSRSIPVEFELESGSQPATGSTSKGKREEKIIVIVV